MLVSQAPGNVQDISNLGVVSFAYGLPTATTVGGGTLRVQDLLGFDVYGEYDLSWSWRQLSQRRRGTHTASAGVKGQTSAPAWMVNVRKTWVPFLLFGEVYSIDPRYTPKLLSPRPPASTTPARATALIWSKTTTTKTASPMPSAPIFWLTTGRFFPVGI